MSRTVVPSTVILRTGVPMIDVRAPAEFARGSFPAAVNLPILNDDERARVGKCYKQHGQETAIALGHRLVSGEVREARIDAWMGHLDQHPDALIFCWRGGLRSALAQQWLAERGRDVGRVEGGYKALRQTALATIEELSEHSMLIVGGRTGVGKTLVIENIPGVIDLEGLADHRGSAFGSRVGSVQPTPIAFENALALAYLHQRSEPLIVFEDEGRTIGRLAVPIGLNKAMKRAPLVVVECSLEERVAHIRREYVDEALGDSGLDALHAHYGEALAKIRDRLGGLAEQQIRHDLDAAFEEHRRVGDGKHEAWIARLLTDYYDRMYDYQLEKSRSRVCFSGSPAEVRARLLEKRNPADWGIGSEG